MKNKTKYILIFSILFFLIALISVATAHEVNAITVSKQNLTDFGELELNKSKKYVDSANSQLKTVDSNKKKINDTKKKIKTYDKQLNLKNKQLKSYNSKLKKLNKKIKTKNIKKSILNTKKNIKAIKKSILTFKKRIKYENQTAKFYAKANDLIYNSIESDINQSYKHLDVSEWAISWATSYSLFGGSNYYDYGYYWKYPEAMNNYYSRQPVDFGLFMSGYYVY